MHRTPCTALSENTFRIGFFRPTHYYYLLLARNKSRVIYLVIGMPLSVGHIPRKGIIAHEDGETVAKIRSAGGIPLLVSNTPEYCTSWESSNFITGRSLNPYDRRRTCGGSSGGEV